MDDFSFVLSEELQTIDPLGREYIYKATQHQSSNDLMVVHYQDEDGSHTANYTKEEIALKVKEGYWIKQFK